MILDTCLNLCKINFYERISVLEKRSSARLREERRLEEILEISETLISEKGFSNFTLSEIIDKTTISRQTFYNLVPSKDMLLVHLGIKGLNKLIGYSERARLYDGYAREILVAQYISYVIVKQLHPILHKCIFSINFHYLESIENNIFVTIFNERIKTFIDYLDWVIVKAEQRNEIILPKTLTSKLFAQAVWNGLYGTSAMALHYNDADYLKQSSFHYREYTRLICDHLGWIPLSTEYDYDAATKRLTNLYFKNEFELMQKRASFSTT